MPSPSENLTHYHEFLRSRYSKYLVAALALLSLVSCDGSPLPPKTAASLNRATMDPERQVDKDYSWQYRVPAGGWTAIPYQNKSLILEVDSGGSLEELIVIDKYSMPTGFEFTLDYSQQLFYPQYPGEKTHVQNTGRNSLTVTYYDLHEDGTMTQSYFELPPGSQREVISNESNLAIFIDGNSDGEISFIITTPPTNEGKQALLPTLTPI